jgi:hypothetical protein
LESEYVKAWKRPFPMFYKLRRKRSEYDSQCILLHMKATDGKQGSEYPVL